jgi:anti-sigma regulatory factor (Ser/Thr protein kinase)
VLLSSELTEGVAVVLVSGPVADADADVLQLAVATAVDVGARGVVVDLAAAGPLPPSAVDVLNGASSHAAGWPRPGLSVCCAPPDLAVLLLPAVHPSREDAFAHVDDRPGQQARVQLRVQPGPEGVRDARRLARSCASELGLDGDDLALVVTELVTNAVRHGAPPVGLEIDPGEHAVTVVVTDGSSDEPRPRDAAPTDEGGRGLELVEALTADSGVRPAPPGKAVWVELARGDA